MFYYWIQENETERARETEQNWHDVIKTINKPMYWGRGGEERKPVKYQFLCALFESQSNNIISTMIIWFSFFFSLNDDWIWKWFFWVRSHTPKTNKKVYFIVLLSIRFSSFFAVFNFTSAHHLFGYIHLSFHCSKSVYVQRCVCFMSACGGVYPFRSSAVCSNDSSNSTNQINV